MSVPTAEQSLRCERKGIPFAFIRRALYIAVGALLIFATVKKAQQLATVPSVGEGLLESYWLNFLAVEWELFLGLWLISGPYPEQTRKFTAAFFVLLFMISAYKYLSGELYCGCFGSLPIRAWQTAILDAFVVIALIGTGKSQSKIRPIPVKRIILVFVLWGIANIPLLRFVSPSDPVDHSAPWSVYAGDDDQMNCVLIPENWVGKKFPLPVLQDEIGLSPELYNNFNIENGTVILFHFDCVKCKDAIEKLPSVDDVTFIEIPSEENNGQLFSLDKYVTLPKDCHWWCETPVIIKVQNGIVRSVNEGEDL